MGSKAFLAFNLLVLGMAATTDAASSCPLDALQLGACAKALGGLVDLKVGDPPVLPCCPLLEGFLDAEAAACLCTAIKTNVLGVVNLRVPIDLSIVLNNCDRPGAYECP